MQRQDQADVCSSRAFATCCRRTMPTRPSEGCAQLIYGWSSKPDANDLRASKLHCCQHISFAVSSLCKPAVICIGVACGLSVPWQICSSLHPELGFMLTSVWPVSYALLQCAGPQTQAYVSRAFMHEQLAGWTLQTPCSICQYEHSASCQRCHQYLNAVQRPDVTMLPLTHSWWLSCCAGSSSIQCIF